MVDDHLRNVAWRVMDAKYFGLPQQRRRLYVIGGGKDFFPENVLFEIGDFIPDPYKTENTTSLSLFDELLSEPKIPTELTRIINGSKIEIFRTYTDCLYAAYGTKWNGNAAAFNGSLFVSQNGRLRRLTNIECERLMGFPDDYTLIEGATFTNRYHSTGNSWAVNVIHWLMDRLINDTTTAPYTHFNNDIALLKDFMPLKNGYYLNCKKRTISVQ